MKSVLKHQIGAGFGALSLGLAASVSAQPITAGPMTAGAIPASSASSVSPSAAFSLGASAKPAAASARSPVSRPAYTAPGPSGRGELTSAPNVQVDAVHRRDLARTPAVTNSNDLMASPAFEANLHLSERRPATPALTKEPSALVAGATKRAGDSILNKISRIIIPNQN